jgi:hypothetical protein
MSQYGHMMVGGYPHWLTPRISPMTTIKAVNHQEAERLIRAGTAKKIELAYDIGSDDFFKLASLWCDKGAKISKGKEHFIVSLKGFRIPPND